MKMMKTETCFQLADRERDDCALEMTLFILGTLHDMGATRYSYGVASTISDRTSNLLSIRTPD